MRLLLLMTVVLAQMPAEARGAVAFHYKAPLTATELAWYSRFDVLVTHDPLPRAQVDALHAKGTKLALYEWSVAFYTSLATPWQRGLPSTALLNADPLRGRSGASDADAFYFDPASPQHANERAIAIAEKLHAIGYDGVFFDTTTHESVHPDALAEFARRHPETTYDAEFARFLRTLRRELSDGVIITNQGFRAAPHILPFVDIDVSESLITRPVQGRFVMRPWLDSSDAWNSISYLMRNLIAPAQRAYPNVRFVHLNYLDTLDEASVARIVAIARMYDAEAFVAQPSISGGTLGEAYFANFGAPRDRIESTAKRTAYRVFARGLAAANFGDATLFVPNPERATYENVVT
ncbi:MAG TPA: hypothetical protein VF787_26025, partial [Thermoanaerobaculia bacterium]